MTFVRDIRKGNQIYRYEVTSYWDKVKKAPRQKVKYLGKVTLDEKKKEVVRKKGFVVDSVEKSMAVGNLAAYFRVASDLSLVELINRHCPKRGQEPGIPLLILTLNQLIGRRPLHKVADWVENTPLSTWLGTKLHLTKDIFLEALDSLCRIENGEIVHYGWNVQKEVVKRWSALYGQDNQRLYYDVTRLKYYGTHCPFAEKGRKSKEGEREIGVALVTSQGSGFPVLCRPIPGAKSDSITARDIAKSLRNWGIPRATIIMDRIMANAPNLKYLTGKKYDVLVGCPETSIEVLRELSRWGDEEIMRAEHIHARGEEEQYVYLKGWSGSLFGVSGKFVVVLDPLRQAEERMNRDWLQKQLTSPETSEELKQQIERRLKKDYSDYGAIQPEHSMATLHREEAVRRRAGRFLLFSTGKDSSDEEIFHWYFQKDEIEKAFYALNNHTCLIPVKYTNPNRVEAYLTINFLAYLIWSVIRHELREKNEKLSVSEILEEAEKITQITFTSKQKKINTLVQPTLAQWGLMDTLKIRNLLPET